MKKILLLSLFIILISIKLFSQEGNNYLLSSAEILKIMNDSKVIYNISFLENIDNFKFPEYKTISDQYFISMDDESTNLLMYELSEEGIDKFNLGEEAYKEKKYDLAISCYKQILLTDKDYFKTYTYIGDMYYMKENYDSAKYYFNLAIEKNFIDYNAHWFLADTYKKNNEIELAVEQITLAHLLNRNHKNMFNILKEYCSIDNNEWTEWDIEPISNTYLQNDSVIIETTENWIGYAFAEAVWKFEPEFTEKLFGVKYDEGSLLYEKEAAGIVANLNLEGMEKINEIIEDGYFQEMLWYEILSKKYPTAVLLLPQEFLSRLINYVNKYH